jgi:hypothetical protein
MDDYDRENYAAVEDFCRIEERCGRIAKLQIREEARSLDIETALDTYLTDVR